MKWVLLFKWNVGECAKQFQIILVLEQHKRSIKETTKKDQVWGTLTKRVCELEIRYHKSAVLRSVKNYSLKIKIFTSLKSLVSQYPNVSF